MSFSRRRAGNQYEGWESRGAAWARDCDLIPVHELASIIGISEAATLRLFGAGEWHHIIDAKNRMRRVAFCRKTALVPTKDDGEYKDYLLLKRKGKNYDIVTESHGFLEIQVK